MGEQCAWLESMHRKWDINQCQPIPYGEGRIESGQKIKQFPDKIDGLFIYIRTEFEANAILNRNIFKVGLTASF